MMSAACTVESNLGSSSSGSGIELACYTHVQTTLDDRCACILSTADEITMCAVTSQSTHAFILSTQRRYGISSMTSQHRESAQSRSRDILGLLATRLLASAPARGSGRAPPPRPCARTRGQGSQRPASIAECGQPKASFTRGPREGEHSVAPSILLLILTS